MLSYLRAVIDFVATYPHVAYGLVFLAALSEALPVIGVFVPGSVVVLAVSALVPTGSVTLWPLLVWATIGAVVGDGFSYWLGRRYKREILLRWPFSRYPQIAAQSEAFFHAHGGKSVFLGRFIPALRAFVPLYAGILLMPARRFYISNVLSALAWAPAHVFPGVIFGASLVLAGAVAGRLAVFANHSRGTPGDCRMGGALFHPTGSKRADRRRGETAAMDGSARYLGASTASLLTRPCAERNQGTGPRRHPPGQHNMDISRPA